MCSFLVVWGGSFGLVDLKLWNFLERYIFTFQSETDMTGKRVLKIIGKILLQNFQCCKSSFSPLRWSYKTKNFQKFKFFLMYFFNYTRYVEPKKSSLDKKF